MFFGDDCDGNYNYKTCRRDVYLYNENIDYYEKVKFHTAFENSMIFEPNGQFRKSVMDYIQAANKGEVSWKIPNASGRFDKDRTGIDHNKETKPFLFATRKDDHGWVKTHYIINMDKWALGPYAKHLGECLVGKMCEGHTEASQSSKAAWLEKAAWDDMLDLVQCIESQPYDANFFRLLIEANQRFSTDADNAFVGEFTPTGGKESFANLTSIREWVPNCHGGLNLPMKTELISGIIYPPGFSSWPCLLTLAAEADNPDSRWMVAAKRAACAVHLVKKFVKTLQMFCPFSEALKPENRQPWFHKPDACTTFWENVVSYSRDPIWLAHLPTTGGRGIAVKGNNTDNILDSTDPRIKSNAGFWNELSRNGNIILPSASGSTATNVHYLSDSVKAALLMGKRSLPILQRLYTVDLAGNPVAQAALLKFILGYAHDNNTNEGIGRLREIVIKLSEPDLKQGLANLVMGLSKLAEKKSVEKTLFKGADIVVTPDNNLDIMAQYPQLNELFAPTKLATNARIQAEKIYEAIAEMWARQYKSAPFTLLGFRDFAATNPEAATLLADLDATVISQELIRVIEEAKGSSATYMVNTEDTDNYVYYRSPLVMSLDLLESTLRQKNPLIRPSDPSVGHNDYFTKGNNNSLDDVWKRPNYIRVGHQAPRDSKPHHGMGFMQRHLLNPTESQSSRTPSSFMKSSSKSSKRTRTSSIYAEDDDDDSDGMADEMHSGYDHESFSSSFDKRRYVDFGAGITKKQLKKTQHLDDDDYRIRVPFSEGHQVIFSEFNTNSFAVNFKDVMQIPDPFVRAAALVGMLCPVDGKCFAFFIEHNIHVPFNMYLWRLFIEHNMSSCVILEGGENTGRNIYGNSNFALGYDTISKLIYGNFTFEGKSWTTEERNIEIIENVKADGYVGGRNCVFIQHDEFDMAQEKYRNRASLLATMIPITVNLILSYLLILSIGMQT